jgi:AraC-like DNA-binding protein
MTVTKLASIYLYKSDRKAWVSRERQHHILSYQLTGSYDHDFSDRTLSVRAGSLFFIRADEAYRVTRREAGEALCVTFSAEVDLPSVVFDCSHEPHVGNLFAKLYALRGNAESAQGHCLAMAVLYELLAILLEKSTPDRMRGDTAARMEAALRYIHTSYREGDVSVARLAAEAGLGKKQFTTLFARRYHTTPTQYVIDLRLRAAAELLRDGLSVGAVAAAVGFSDVYYFSRLFKRRFLIPPSAYARRP